MDNYSILGQDPPKGMPSVPPPRPEEPAVAAKDDLRFPAEDAGKSLAEMAERDLQAALQLLAERAQYITGATGAAIALREGSHMICQASVGACAPENGAELQVNSGLTGESVRRRAVLRCDDAERDPRVNRESCRALGIKSVMVMPLVRADEVVGVFELLSDRSCAFEERDVVAIERLSEMILIAMEHADAAKRAPAEIATKMALSPPAEQKAATPAVATESEKLDPLAGTAPESVAKKNVSNIRTCQACGFPVSEGRSLCLDCEAARADTGDSSTGDPGFLSQTMAEAQNESWFDRNLYTIGTVVMVALTMIVLLLKFR
jgi:putative methionine-R-sulfoxide reductase with GAF domain